MYMDFGSLDASSVTTLIICGLIVVVAIVRFIIYLFSKKDK